MSQFMPEEQSRCLLGRCVQGIASLREGDSYGWDLPFFLCPASSVGVLSGAHVALFFHFLPRNWKTGSRVQLGGLAGLAGVREGRVHLHVCPGAGRAQRATSHLGWTLLAPTVASRGWKKRILVVSTSLGLPVFSSIPSSFHGS